LLLLTVFEASPAVSAVSSAETFLAFVQFIVANYKHGTR
jgi:hypothetical protein